MRHTLPKSLVFYLVFRCCGAAVLRCCGAAVLRCPGGLVFCEENEMNPAVGGKRDSVGIRKPLNLR